MKKIGLLSDTHGYWDEKYVTYFSSCDEIWHAGDIGSEEVLTKLRQIKPVRAVYGNIDSYTLRAELPEFLAFTVEETTVFLIHIGGYPGRYAPGIKEKLRTFSPDIFVCGHSHILKVMYDKAHNLLTVNPGAAGKFGFHQQRTILRFCIDGKNIKDMEIIELNDK